MVFGRTALNVEINMDLHHPHTISSWVTSPLVNQLAVYGHTRKIEPMVEVETVEEVDKVEIERVEVDKSESG